MGVAVARLALAAGDVIVGAAAGPGDPAQGKDLGEVAGIGTLGVTVAGVTAALLGAEVVIDFSTAAAVPKLAAAAFRERVAIVSGTTNLDEKQMASLREAAKVVPVLWAGNMSLGIQVLAEVVEQAVRRLGAEFDVEIVEMHHGKKVDAPSGTAKRLVEAVRAARSPVDLVHGREGEVGARRDAEVAVLALRGGDVVGDHTVHLLGPGERLELTHRATTRDVFALGALRAARWILGKGPGMYVMKDVLGRASD